MEENDGDTIAYIYPALGTIGQRRAQKTIKSNIGRPGYTPPRRSHSQDQAALCCGTSDKFNKENGGKTVNEESRDPLEYEACIKVTFNHIPKTRHGLRCGHGEDAELSFDFLKGIGLYHFALTFDDNYHLIVRDLGSMSGTTVVYGRTERGPWSDFSWIVGGSDFLKGTSPITVKIPNIVHFQLVIPYHDNRSKIYRDQVDRFRTGSADIDQIFSLGNVSLLSHARTALPSGIRTHATKPARSVTIQKKIGEGSFASVYRVLIVNTGEQYALKRPKKWASVDRDAWEREALIMLQIKHVSLK